MQITQRLVLTHVCTSSCSLTDAGGPGITCQLLSSCSTTTASTAATAARRRCRMPQLRARQRQVLRPTLCPPPLCQTYGACMFLLGGHDLWRPAPQPASCSQPETPEPACASCKYLIGTHRLQVDSCCTGIDWHSSVCVLLACHRPAHGSCPPSLGTCRYSVPPVKSCMCMRCVILWT